jgi:hypothetical protein
MPINNCTLDNAANKLPEELRANYRANRKGPAVIEELKAAAALKLWRDRGHRNVRFEVPLALGRKKLFIKVLAQEEDRMVGLNVLQTSI